jgi:hypothetical protein
MDVVCAPRSMCLEMEVMVVTRIKRIKLASLTLQKLPAYLAESHELLSNATPHKTIFLSHYTMGGCQHYSYYKLERCQHENCVMKKKQ